MTVTEYLDGLRKKGQKTTTLHIVEDNRTGLGSVSEYAATKKAAEKYSEADYVSYYGEKVRIKTNYTDDEFFYYSLKEIIV